MKIELVVFDLAGTTVEDHRDVQKVLQRTLSKFDIFITLEEADEVMGIPKPIAIRSLLEKYDDSLNSSASEKIENIHALFVKDMVAFYETDASVKEAQGVSNTFKVLKEKGIRIAVDTGFDRRTTNALLNRLGWNEAGLIDFSITSDEVANGRPFPDMILKAMQVLNVTDPAHVAKVGDTVSDLQEGSAAGCGLVVGITTGAYSKEELLKEKPSYIIDAIPELIPILSFSNISQEA